ncbi:hypothetical protein [Clostridium botulinum]|uniref:hypothetical protein n=1 Tax=Clostridium botulinum TaxID=1491 RepID=UPI0006A724AF|nr:hypothetical protein [Clostridium botulinum]KAI3350137.1 hypothetical protein CIT18_04470 [Clostridium botulinum]KOM88952.1 hypothetical protein ACP51_04255 [Clostridium botulinum]KOR63518.1 hypothetical protein ADT22_03040 [Clostridium botulinum]MCS6111533.1 hypothetical protein [Clostridium botulinum]NFE10953.1 hypothetical protein [Clostridium botulinum]
MRVTISKIKKFFGIENIKDFLEVVAWITTAFIAILTLNIYSKQLKLDEHLNEPVFEISVIQDTIDDTYEQYLQIINTGKAIENKEIDTEAILLLQRTENEDNSTLKNIQIRVENFFYNENDMMNYGNNLAGVICRRETNFNYIDIQNQVLDIRSKLNSSYNKTIQVYPDFIYFIKISYRNYDGKEKNRYYKVGRYNNKEIAKEEYESIFNLPIIDVKKEYHDVLVDFIK